jgi:glutathione S-transferase
VSSPLVLVSHVLCPYVQRAVIALHEKGVPFQRIDIDLENKPDWFSKISPTGRTPLLRVGDAVLFESAAIVEYLEDTTPHPLHPSDPIGRARARAWMEQGSAMLGDIWSLEIATDERAYETARIAIRGRIGVLETALGDGPWFFGERFSTVDVVFAPVFRYFDAFDQRVDTKLFEAAPKVARWRRLLAERPSVRAAVHEDYAERLWEFLTKKSSHLTRLE